MSIPKPTALSTKPSPAAARGRLFFFERGGEFGDGNSAPTPAAFTIDRGEPANWTSLIPAFGFDPFISSGIPMPHERLERAVVLRDLPAGWFEMYVRRSIAAERKA